MTTQSPAPQEPAGHGRVWPYLAGAAAAAALGVSLFAMGSDPEPSPTPAASAGSAQARVSEAPTAPVTSPATSAIERSHPSDKKKPRFSEIRRRQGSFYVCQAGMWTGSAALSVR